MNQGLQTMLNVGTASFEYDSKGNLTGWDAGSLTTADIGGAFVNLAAGGLTHSITNSYMGPMNPSAAFSNQFGKALQHHLVSRGINGIASGINHRMGSRNVLAQRYGLSALAQGWDLAEKASETDQGRRVADFFRGFAFWRDENSDTFLGEKYQAWWNADDLGGLASRGSVAGVAPNNTGSASVPWYRRAYNATKSFLFGDELGGVYDKGQLAGYSRTFRGGRSGTWWYRMGKAMSEWWNEDGEAENEKIRYMVAREQGEQLLQESGSPAELRNHPEFEAFKNLNGITEEETTKDGSLIMKFEQDGMTGYYESRLMARLTWFRGTLRVAGKTSWAMVFSTTIPNTTTMAYEFAMGMPSTGLRVVMSRWCGRQICMTSAKDFRPEIQEDSIWRLKTE